MIMLVFLAICNEKCANGGRCIAPNTCDCPPGLTGTSCETDIDECKDRNLNRCHKTRGSCENTFGGHFCRCNNGYQYKGGTCAG